jgi:3-deoxy-D-manno-octulosonic-acid transferase
MIWLLYNLLFPVVFLAMLPYYLFRMGRRGGYARGFLQRLAVYDAALRARLSAAPRVWVHAVSVGETYVALRFMDEWRTREPGTRFVMSVNTSTAHALAAKSLPPGDVLVYFPVDVPPVLALALRRLRPRLLVLTEGEFWPNLIRMCRARGIPVALINGRMSDRSFRGYGRFRPLFRAVLRRIACLCLQGERDRERFLALGADAATVHVTGSGKYDVALKEPGDPAKGAAILATAGMGQGDLILLGGSTWPGEEDVLLDFLAARRARFPSLKLVLVPRHAERRDEVVQAIRRRGLPFVQRSRGTTSAEAVILLADTTGELRHLYTVATAIFVGKSLTQHGGQNLIEPAACGKPVVVGPNMENFADITRDFLAAGAVLQVADAERLAEALDRLLAEEAPRREQGARAAALVARNRGSVAAMVEQVRRLPAEGR